MRSILTAKNSSMSRAVICEWCSLICCGKKGLLFDPFVDRDQLQYRRNLSNLIYHSGRQAKIYINCFIHGHVAQKDHGYNKPLLPNPSIDFHVIYGKLSWNIYIILSCSKHITNSHLIYLCVVFKQVGVVLFENTVQYKILLRSDNHKCQFMKDLNALPVVTGGGTNAKGGN